MPGWGQEGRSLYRRIAGQEKYSEISLEVLGILQNSDGEEEFIIRVNIVESRKIQLLLSWLYEVEEEGLKQGYLDFTRRDMVFIIDYRWVGFYK